jgi:Primase C terminal 2 (PriCT-2)
MNDFSPDTVDFLRALCGSGAGWLSISYTMESHLKSLRSSFFEATDIVGIQRHLESLPKGAQVIFNFARISKVPSSGRGRINDTHAFSVIGMDIDIADPTKPNKLLPSSINEAIMALESLPLPPSILVNSGRGLHAYWKLEADVVVSDVNDLKFARSFVADFYRGVEASLPQYKFDRTQDLARSFRMPGSTNLKEIADPRQVQIREIWSDRIYSHEDISQMSISAISKERAVRITAPDVDSNVQKVDLQLMEAGCGWVRDALVHGSTATYETWWGMASLLSKVENGRELFHEWSKKHPDYDPNVVDAKFDQVDPEKADRTCDGLAALPTSAVTGAEVDGMNRQCARCVFREGIKSPVELGIPGIRTVVINNAQLRTKAASLWAGVHTNNHPRRLFSFNRQIARIKEENAQVELLDVNIAKYEFARLVNWMQEGKNDWGTHVDPSLNVIGDALSTHKPPLPELTQVVSIPIVTSEGRLIAKPGYDTESGVFYAAEPGCLPKINSDASKDDALEALKWLEEEILVDFPFADEASKAAAISIAILPFVRQLINGQTPLYLLEKPAAGTGATTLGLALCYPFMGKEIPVTTWTSNEEERRKQITAHLASGGGPIFYDNMSGYVNSDVLASALTSQNWSDRILSTSKQAEFPINATWLATGNNPEFHAQILRRIASIRLVSLMEDPSQRTNWRHADLIHWISTHRKEYVEAILTIVMAWLNEGMPEFQGKPLASYVSWSSVMGGILQFVDVPGFLENIDLKKAAMDNESQVIREFIEAWWEEFHGEAKTPTDIVTDFSAMEAAGNWDAPTRQGQVSKVGRWMAHLKDRVYVIGTTTVQVTQSARKYYLKVIKTEEK